jgi:hypothetical protein
MECGKRQEMSLRGRTLLYLLLALGLARSGGPFVGFVDKLELVILVDCYDLSTLHTHTSKPTSANTTTSTL